MQNAPAADMVITGIRRLVNPVFSGGCGCSVRVVHDAAIASCGGSIVWAGPESTLGESVAVEPGANRVSAGGMTALPGFVECHTHLVFAGSRAADFERRARGETYADIARSGGGIMTTVLETRKAKPDELVELAKPRLGDFLKRGVTTIEIKSGYGLDAESELKILDVVSRLKKAQPCRIVPTFMGAHAVPAEHRDSREKYIGALINEMLPEVSRRKTAVFCDVFCDETAFSVPESESILRAASRLGLKPKVHADQLTPSGGAELAARVGAVSAEHLEHVSDKGIRAMSFAGVTAVLLPTASIFSGSKVDAPARKIIDGGVRAAVSTDFNPGSSNTRDLALAGTIACTRMGMTLEEALCGITINAAAALGLEKEIGSIEPGKSADIALIDTDDWRDIFYMMGENLVREVFRNGKRVFPGNV